MRTIHLIKGLATGRVVINFSAVFTGGPLFDRQTNVDPSSLANGILANLFYLMIFAVLIYVFWVPIALGIAFIIIGNLTFRFVGWLANQTRKPFQLFG